MDRIGFIGLGAMGRPIALRIREAGYPMTVCDREAAALAPLVVAGAATAPSPAAVAEASDIVFAMVPDAPDAEEVALGPGGVIEGGRPGLLYVDMSTIDPVTTRRIGGALGQRGMAMIDCPVGRTTQHAAEGKLVLMIGGEPADIDRVQPIFDRLGDTLIRCGPLGTGSATKVVNNYLAMACSTASAEALAMGVKAGLSVEHMLEVFKSTMAANAHVLQVMPQQVLAGNVEPGFMVSLGHKDVRLGLALAEAYGMQTPVGSGVFTSLSDAKAKGHGRSDVSSVLLVREQEVGVTVRLQFPGQ